MNPAEILSELKKYSRNIYTKVLGSIAKYNKFLKDDNIVKLEAPGQNICKRPISEHEAKELVNNMKSNKPWEQMASQWNFSILLV